MRLGILCSGKLGFHCLNLLLKKVKPQFIFTDKQSIEIIEFAKSEVIPIFIGNPGNENSFDFIKNFPIDLIFSINYLFIVNKAILEYPRLFGINFHGSLLPKYRGRTPHVWAIINGEMESGITAHVMEENCDTGDIVFQEKITIDSNFTGADLLEIFKVKYPEIIFQVLELINNKNLQRIKQDEGKATYFGKRTPEDGRINWEWHKERIHNWIRAQAYPYPGAFTYHNGEKIIIDKISFSETGFDSRMENGLILEIDPDVLVKTSNGIVKLEVIRDNNKEMLMKNNILI